MNAQHEQQNRRILVIDDNDAIHQDFRKILGGRADTAVLDELRTSLLGAKPTAPGSIRYELDTASQGQEGLEKVRQALEEDSPYCLAFVDMRMPPGWDGLETIEQIWRADPNIQIVICTAYSDYSWKEIHERLGQTDGLLILKKPFDIVEVRQLACALTQKWHLAQQAQLDLDDMETTVQQRTAELQFEISDRRQAQTALQEREAQTRAILQAAADAIVTIDDQGIITTFNRAAEELFGYGASEIIGQNVSVLAPSPHREEHDDHIQRYLRTGQSRIIGLERELDAVRRDGSMFPMALRVTEMNHNGQRGFIAIVQDITERKQLRVELELLARFPAENPEPVIRADSDGHVIYANAVSGPVLEAWGTSPGGYLPQPWPDTIAEVLRSGQCRAVEIRSGEKFLTFTLAPVVEAGYVNFFGQDITDRVKAEVELRRSEREFREQAEELERQKAQLVNEVAQRMGAEAQARHDAMHDSLTGLSNRAVLLDRIERCLHRTKREKDFVFALLFLDFDRFKVINDSLGHEVGDQLLISMADRLKGSLRIGDTTSRVDQEPDPGSGNLSVRLGGDEFVILLDGIKKVADATLVAERLQKSLEKPHKIGSHEVTSTASIGIVTSDLGYDSADEMLRDADTAMYRAKAAGRARHQLFDRAMHNEAVVRLALENDLRHALQHEQFRLVYQPIIDLRTGLAVGVEALIRWNHPERGIISPLDFIPVAEEIGLIVPIGGWVLLEACQQLKQWQDQFSSNPPLSMNVNISKRQLTHSDLVETIKQVLETTNIEPHTLKLEITESAIMDSLDDLKPVLERLRACGVFLCIDDFGTGHSSLSCLHEFPIEVLKIDRAFLDNMKENREYAAVTQAIVTLAQNLGMDVVAEGVETPEQVAQLQALETDYAQGYYFARPLSPEDAAAFLQTQGPLAKSA